jgi:hypothetical protein
VPFILLGVIVVISLIRIASGSHATQPEAVTGTGSAFATSCLHPNFAVLDSSYPVGGEVRLAVTGPPSETYLVYVDVAAVTGTGAAQTRVPDPGIAAADTELLASYDELPDKCAEEQFPSLATRVGPGRHTLALFRENRDQTQTLLQTIPITVT